MGRNHYDYLLVGAGLYSAVFAYHAMQHGKTCLVLERRNHIGGNVYCENIEGINVHKYGALDLCQYFEHKKLKGYADFFNSSSSFCCGVI